MSAKPPETNTELSDLHTVQGLAEAGYGVFHDMPGFHPEANSPISKDGHPHRARLIAGLNPQLSTSTFQEGVPATATFAGDVHLLAASGNVVDASGCDNGTTVTRDGKRVSSRHQRMPKKDEIASAITPDSGYNELTVDAFTPAAVVVNLDEIMSEKMAKLHIISEPDKFTEGIEQRLRVAAAIKGDVSFEDRFGYQPLSDAKNWIGIARTAVCAFESAAEFANLTSETKLPVYAIVSGRLHEFKGFGPEHAACTEVSKKNAKGGDYSARKISWLHAIQKNTSLPEQMGGEGKSLLERLAPLVHLEQTPTPLKVAITKAPEISAAQKAALSYSVVPFFKQELQSIPINKFTELAPTETERPKAIELADNLPELRDGLQFHINSRMYDVRNDQFHNLSVYGNDAAGREKARADVDRLNGPVSELMSHNSRIVPTTIYASGVGKTTGNHADAKDEAGFNPLYRDDPKSQQLFEVTQERIKKFGPEGVIYVDPRQVVAANEMHLRDPSYHWVDDPKKELAQTIDDQWKAIQAREQSVSKQPALPKQRQMGRSFSGLRADTAKAQHTPQARKHGFGAAKLGM